LSNNRYLVFCRVSDNSLQKEWLKPAKSTLQGIFNLKVKSMKKVLVTGATGFVGAVLAKKLVTLGYDVSIILRKQSNCWRIKDIKNDLTIYDADLKDFSGILNVIQKIKPEIIFHLASFGGHSFQKDSQEIIYSNFLGTINLLKACQTIDFESFVNTGSSSEYGIKTKPMNEMDSVQPIGDYGVSKTAATLFCQSEAIQKNLPIVNLRIFSPYGPWDEQTRFIPYVIKGILENVPIKLSCPSFVRDYIYIEDILQVYLKFLNRTSFKGEIFNVGSGQQISLGNIVEIIKTKTSSNPYIEWEAIPNKQIEPKVWQADIDKAKTLLGFTPNYSLEDGLEKTINWIKERGY
jgi:nucleoside-diphosphate-sugar epimerase